MKIEQAQKLKEEMLRKASGEEEETPLQKARRLIYESEDIIQDAETIKALLEGRDATEVAVILAELYFHYGMQKRAEQSLKAYKRSIERTEKVGDLRLINQALELARNRRTLPYKWEEIWKTLAEEEKEFPSAPGEDGAR